MSISLRHLALLIVLSAWTASAAWAQTAETVRQDLETPLLPGTTVWITDTAGREQKTRIVDLTGDIVTTTTDGGLHRVRMADVTRVRARHNDSVVNGALIGAGAAVATGLFLCRLTEPWENCRDDVGPMVRIGAVGAGIGMAIDALIRGRKTIYEAPDGSARVHAAPTIGRRGGGLQFSLTF
jgi:hypothetical protein